MSPADQIQEIGAFVKNLSIKQKAISVAAVAFVIAGFVLLMSWTNRPHHEVLFTNLSQDDAAAIVAKLKEKKILYQLEANGTTIMVPQEQVYETRLVLAGEGLPGGEGWRIFDKRSFIGTQFDDFIKWLRATQGELSRTISWFREVEGARVHIAADKDSLFGEQLFAANEKKPTASVIVKLKGGMTLNNNQLQSIVHLVANAVPRLDPEDVTIADVTGRIFYKKSSSDMTGLSNAQLEYQQGVEEGLRKKVEGILKDVLGPDKVIARVAADIDFQQVNIVEEKFDPDSAVLRSEQVSEETSEGGSNVPAGVPGVKGNLANRLEGNAVFGNQSTFQKESRTGNYEINKISRQVVGPAGTIKRLSVAVMIDYKETAGKGDEKSEYVPRNANEMSQFENIVKKTIGFDETRGDQVEVQSVQFSLPAKEEIPATSSWQEYLQKAWKPALNVILVLIFILFVGRPLIKWVSNRPVLSNLPMSLSELEKAQLMQGEANQALQLAQNQPDRAADLVRKWLKEK